MYYVYHIASTTMIKGFSTASAAKRSTTCMNRKAGSEQYAWATQDDYYANVVKKIKVRSLMTGNLVEIDSNTPWVCRPDSEAFWSM